MPVDLSGLTDEMDALIAAGNFNEVVAGFMEYRTENLLYIQGLVDYPIPALPETPEGQVTSNWTAWKNWITDNAEVGSIADIFALVKAAVLANDEPETMWNLSLLYKACNKALPGV